MGNKPTSTARTQDEAHQHPPDPWDRFTVRWRRGLCTHTCTRRPHTHTPLHTKRKADNCTPHPSIGPHLHPTQTTTSL